MILELGGRGRFDVAHRAVVLGALGTAPLGADLGALDERVAELAGAGADALELVAPHGDATGEAIGAVRDATARAVRAVRARTELPLVVSTWNPVVLGAALDAGADAGHDPTGFVHPDWLVTCVRSGASVVAAHCRFGPVPVPPSQARSTGDALRRAAGRAVAAGVPEQRVVLDLGAAAVADGAAAELAARGLRVLGALSGAGGDAVTPGALAASVVLAVEAGCRMVRTVQVAAVRRTVDVVAAISRAAGDEVPGPARPVTVP